MKQKWIMTLVCLFLLLFSVRGSHFKNYKIENGLSSNSVWTVMQDSKGFMWFGTKDGLNRFDGRNFKVYRNSFNDSLSIGHNFIHCIKEDSRKRMLIGTRQGLYLYNREKDNFKHVPLAPAQEKEVNINDIMEDLQGNIWVACHGQGLYKLTSELIVEKHYLFKGEQESIQSNFIWTIVTDHYGNLWIGTAGIGLIHFDIKNERFTPIVKRRNLETDNQSIYSIHCDNDNNLWIGTSTNGLFKYNHISGKATHYLKNTGSVKSIKEYSDEELIMGSDKGLIIFNKKTERYRVMEDNSTDNSIFSITRDNEGSFWVGTYFGGVNYFSPMTNNFSYYTDLQENNSTGHIVSSIVEDIDGTILISTHNNNNIYRFIPETRETEIALEMKYNNIQSLLRDDDMLYVSTYGRGIDIISLPEKRTIEKLNINTVEGKSIFKVRNGGMIFTLEEGGCVFRDPNGHKKRLEELSGVLIADVIQDANGSVWFATYSRGLFCWKKDGTWEQYSLSSEAPFSFASNSISCLLSYSNHLWVGTTDAGIILFDTNTKKIIKTFDNKNGLPSRIIYSILSDNEGNIWATTKEGIIKIGGDTHEIQSFGYIGKRMQYNFRSALHSSKDQLYFGGASGFILINPKEFALNEHVPAVAITGLKIFNKSVSPGEKSSPLKSSIENTKEIVLKRNQSNFSLEFVSLSYIFPENNKYAYILEGFDKEWNHVTENTAQYMNIPHGKYVFRVKGTNNDGLWDNSGTSLIIRIKPPFWLTVYMIAFYTVFTIGMVIFMIRWHIRYVNKKSQEKQYKYQVAQEKEMYESKINFFTNIAHEIRTPLSLISAPLENIILSKDGSQQTRKNLSTIERNTNRLLDLVNQLLDFRKIENDMFLLNFRYQDIPQILQKVHDQYSQEAGLKNIKMSLNISSKKILGYIDSEALYKIISNLISNAIKFARNKIEIQLGTKNDMLFLSVRDDGIGIKNEYKDEIFKPFYQIKVTGNYSNNGSGLGLSLSRSLARKLGGDISVQSEYTKYCLFTLELPILTDVNISEQKYEENNIGETEQQEFIELTESESDAAILIVEDNEDLRSFMKECLIEHYGVFEAENGLKALQILENNMIDIIISDIIMPEMDGLELCNELKMNTAYSHLPFILLSARTDTSTKIDGLNKGADIYMEKPFSIEQLKAQISSIIENRAIIRKKFVESPLQYFKSNAGNTENAHFIKRLNTFILENMSDENFSIDGLSDEFAMSRTNFQKKIKNITGLTPNNYIKLIRLNKSVELLSTGEHRINEVCFIVGFNSPSYFSKCFFEHFGKLPKDFIRSNF